MLGIVHAGAIFTRRGREGTKILDTSCNQLVQIVKNNKRVEVHACECIYIFIFQVIAQTNNIIFLDS